MVQRTKQHNSNFTTPPQLNIPDEDGFLPLPVVGLHNARKWAVNGMLRHDPPVAAPTNEIVFNEKAYAAHMEEVYRHNAQVYDDSLTKLPIETYNKYAKVLSKHKFLEFKQGEQGNLLVYDDVRQNFFWVNDVAQIVQVTRRVFNKEMLKRAVVEVRDDYLFQWHRQLDAMADTPLPTDTQLYKTTKDSRVVEQYDDTMKVLYSYPCTFAAAKAIGVNNKTIFDAVGRGYRCCGFWFRNFYDNDFEVVDRGILQIKNGQVVNRFNSLKEAATLLHMSVDNISRLTRSPDKVDQFGCKWERIERTKIDFNN